MRFVRLLIILLVMVLGVAFAVMNTATVSLNYYFGTCEMPLPLLLVATLFVGAVLGIMVSLGGMLRLKRENVGLRRKAELAAVEVKNLRAIPLEDK